MAKSAFKLLAVAAAAVVSLSAQAQTAHIAGEAPFVLDETGALLVGLHPADTTGFLDIFGFTVSGPATISGAFLLPGLLSSLVDPAALPILATPLLFSIIDSNGVTLAADDFTDGVLAVSTQVAAGGTYGFAVAGVGGESLGLYVAAASAQIAAVPEPETYSLALAGLGLVGWMARRRKAA